MWGNDGDQGRATRRFVDDLNKQFANQVATINAHAKEFSRVWGAINEVMAHQQMEAYKTGLRETYASASGYVNVIMGVGYAGYFGLWALTKDHLSAKASAASAIFLSISLITFVSWEVYRMLSTAMLIRSMEDALANDDRDGGGLVTSAADRVRTVVSQHNARVLRHWAFALAASIVPAVIGVGFLVWALAERLVAVL